jgi:hypothetical protein
MEGLTLTPNGKSLVGTPVPVAKDPYGYDSEGLVAMRDGTFWVSTSSMTSLVSSVGRPL